MRAADLHEHARKIGSWVDWNDTVDEFLVGDPDVEVAGIAVSWMPTFSTLERARELGCNLFVTHEPLYLSDPDEARLISPDDPWVRKKSWLEETGMMVYRCHDLWDDYPAIGIHGAWAKWLGFTDPPLSTEKYYEVHGVEGLTLGELARIILERVKPLGQEAVHVIGDPEREVSRIALGTGAITNYRRMHALGADVLLLTDDGTRLWESAQWARDGGASLILVNHATSEEPGMISLAVYLRGVFPEAHVEHILGGCLYRTIS
jgi:putative NIF3 family GTP cyclohydrolase 1 type 2